MSYCHADHCFTDSRLSPQRFTLRKLCQSCLRLFQQLVLGCTQVCLGSPLSAVLQFPLLSVLSLPGFSPHLTEAPSQHFLILSLVYSFLQGLSMSQRWVQIFLANTLFSSFRNLLAAFEQLGRPLLVLHNFSRQVKKLHIYI